MVLVNSSEIVCTRLYSLCQSERDRADSSSRQLHLATHKLSRISCGAHFCMIHSELARSKAIAPLGSKPGFNPFPVFGPPALSLCSLILESQWDRSTLFRRVYGTRKLSCVMCAPAIAKEEARTKYLHIPPCQDPRVASKAFFHSPCDVHTRHVRARSTPPTNYYKDLKNHKRVILPC